MHCCTQWLSGRIRQVVASSDSPDPINAQSSEVAATQRPTKTHAAVELIQSGMWAGSDSRTINKFGQIQMQTPAARLFHRPAGVRANRS
jgi:hypothetical protein